MHYDTFSIQIVLSSFPEVINLIKRRIILHSKTLLCSKIFRMQICPTHSFLREQDRPRSFAKSVCISDSLDFARLFASLSRKYHKGMVKGGKWPIIDDEKSSPSAVISIQTSPRKSHSSALLTSRTFAEKDAWVKNAATVRSKSYSRTARRLVRRRCLQRVPYLRIFSPGDAAGVAEDGKYISRSRGSVGIAERGIPHAFSFLSKLLSCCEIFVKISIAVVNLM